MAEYETLLYEEDDGVAIVTMNRPEVHNAFNELMQSELHTLWRSLRTNDDVRAVVWTGAGEKAFCTGLDREETITQYLEDPTPAGRRRGLRVDAVHVQRPRREHQPEAERHVEAGHRRGERHGLRRRALHARRVRHHHRRRARDVLRPPRHLRDGGRVRVGPPAAEAPARRDAAARAPRQPRAACPPARAHDVGLVSEVVPARPADGTRHVGGARRSRRRRCSRSRARSAPSGWPTRPDGGWRCRRCRPRSTWAPPTTTSPAGQEAFRQERIEWRLR